MGTILSGYGEDAYQHEGYPAQVLDDGSITGTHSTDTRPRMIGQVVAACGCGWAGTTRYPSPDPLDEQAEALALAEWETTHALPILNQARQNRTDRLAQLLGTLAEQHRAHLQEPPDRHRLELLDRTLRTLAAATELARELRDHAPEQQREAER